MRVKRVDLPINLVDTDHGEFFVSPLTFHGDLNMISMKVVRKITGRKV